MIFNLESTDSAQYVVEIRGQGEYQGTVYASVICDGTEYTGLAAFFTTRTHLVTLKVRGCAGHAGRIIQAGLVEASTAADEYITYDVPVSRNVLAALSVKQSESGYYGEISYTDDYRFS